MTRRIRLARSGDAAAIARIYAPIVAETAISFEASPPSREEMASRISSQLRETPWIVCEIESALAGYAYAGKFRARPAYQWTVEVTVYVDEDHHGRGVGSSLYRSLLACLKLQGFHSAVAGIALPNPASVKLHQRFGFEPIGVFPAVGYKLGNWHDVGWWRLVLRDFESSPAPPRPISELIADPEWQEALKEGELS